MKSRVEILGDVLEGLGEEVQEVITTMDEYERVLRDVLYERQQIDPTYERVGLTVMILHKYLLKSIL